MRTSVDLLHTPDRKKPHVVRWWGDPDPRTGKQKRYGRAFRYRHDAKAFHIEKQAAFQKGQPRDPVNITLEELIADFQEARLKTRKHSTKEGYQNTFDQLLEYFGPKKTLQNITRRDAESFIASRQRVDGRKGELSSWSRKRHVIHCKALFGAALEWEYLDINPFQPTKSSGQSPLNIKPTGRSWHYLTPEEFTRLLAVVDCVKRRAAYWLMYGSGLRPGEVFNLTANCVDLEQRRVHIVNREATNDLPPFSIKADGQSAESKERSVPIPEAAITDIQEALLTSFKSGGLVVITPQRYRIIKKHWRFCHAGQSWHHHPWRPWNTKDLLNNYPRDTKKFLQQAGIELTASFNLQAFRKSFAQNHAQAGTPPKTLAKLLGHANTRVTMQHYNQITDANEREAGETMDRVLAIKPKVVQVG